MTYVLQQYDNMRGTYFVRHLKGSTRSSLTDQMVDNQATRTRVKTKVACSKAGANANSERNDDKVKNLWKQAEDDVY